MITIDKTYESQIKRLTRIRLLVFQLGEKESWWTSNIIAGNGLEFLKYTLPKTANTATVQLAFEIARNQHDKQVNYGKYHLFRLRPIDEERIFELIKSKGEVIEVKNREELLAELLELSSNISIDSQKGAVQIGTIGEIYEEELIQTLAKHYHQAFSNQIFTYPYFN